MISDEVQGYPKSPTGSSLKQVGTESTGTELVGKNPKFNCDHSVKAQIPISSDADAVSSMGQPVVCTKPSEKKLCLAFIFPFHRSCASTKLGKLSIFFGNASEISRKCCRCGIFHTYTSDGKIHFSTPSFPQLPQGPFLCAHRLGQHNSLLGQT